MKQFLILVLILTISNIALSKTTEEVKKMNETYRNQFHFSPEINKMGSPISIWLKDSTYHLYYQYNPKNLMEGFVNWGHATSANLLNWEHHELTLIQPAGISDSMQLVPWFGSVVDQKGDALAWVNRWNDGIYQTKSVDGESWEKEVETKGTDKLDKSESCVFWHEATQKWVMFAFERPTTTMFILNSDDGLNWEEASSFNYRFGFPQLVELPVDRKPDVTRWVMFTENSTYIVGQFDGKKFDIETTVLRSNYGKKIGGSIVFNDQPNERVVAISEIKSDQQADMASNGFMSFPTQLSLHEYITGIELHQTPIDEIETLYLKTYSWEDVKIYPGISNNLLKKVKGMELLIKGEIDLLNCDMFGFLIRSDRNKNGTEINYNVKSKVIDMLNSQFEYTPVNNKVEFKILVDRSSIELYIDGGRYVVSSAFDPSPELLRYELFSMGGEIMVDWMEVYRLKSVWREE